MGTRNYRQRRFEMVDRVDGRQLIEDKVRSSGCFRCPVQCKADLKFKDGAMKGQTATRPEFEPMINLGPNAVWATCRPSFAWTTCAPAWGWIPPRQPRPSRLPWTFSIAASLPRPMQAACRWRGEMPRPWRP
jgi:hypothetical protein